MLDYRCGQCRRVFNAFTGTVFQKTPSHSSELVLILCGIAQGVPTAKLARELKVNRPHLLLMRHKLQANSQARLDRTALPDTEVEADEMYKNAERKRRSTPRRGRPAATSRQKEARTRHLRHQPTALVGRGGPPLQARLRLKLARRMWGVALVGYVKASNRPGSTVYADDWGAYRKLKAEDRRHRAVSHQGPHRDWAKDLDGEGVREAHSNTMEGIWTGVRIFWLRSEGSASGASTSTRQSSSGRSIAKPPQKISFAPCLTKAIPPIDGREPHLNPAERVLAWSEWRRAHQQHPKECHYKKRDAKPSLLKTVAIRFSITMKRAARSTQMKS